MKKIIVGSRESKLAVIQAMTVVNYLKNTLPGYEIELKTMKTTGDKILDRTLDKIGGKGLFVKELDRALRDGEVDITVHSLKDVPMEVAEDIPLIGFSKREDPRDVLVLPEKSVENLPIGSASLRRNLQFKKLFPNSNTEPIRGNLQTRLKKLDEGQYSALILAAAGLKRLGLENRISRYFTTDEMIPATGQGILALQGRKGGDYSYLSGYFDSEAKLCAICERAFTRTLNGGCTSPVCAHARIENGNIYVKGLYYDEKTGNYYTDELKDDIKNAEKIGITLAEKLMKNS